jgi:hypothetical protein
MVYLYQYICFFTARNSNKPIVFIKFNCFIYYKDDCITVFWFERGDDIQPMEIEKTKDGNPLQQE